jgi:hypothetical protein
VLWFVHHEILYDIFILNNQVSVTIFREQYTIINIEGDYDML